jgi:hypothetical protein
VHFVRGNQFPEFVRQREYLENAALYGRDPRSFSYAGVYTDAAAAPSACVSPVRRLLCTRGRRIAWQKEEPGLSPGLNVLRR